MKIFVVALTVLALLISVITINAVAVCSTVDQMISATRDMSPNPSEASAAELSQLWDDKKNMICITVSHNDTDAFIIAFGNLLASIAAEDEANYLEAKNAILIILHDIKHSETLSLDRIL